MHSTGISKGWTLAFVSFRKILTFAVSPFWRREAFHRSLAPACSALPWATQHTPWTGRGAHSGSKPTAAAPWAPAPPGRRRDQPQGSARDSSSGAGGHDQMIHCYYSYCLSVPTSPYSPQSLMTQCHIQVVTWSLGVMYQSNNRGKQHSGSKVLPIAL